MPSTADASGLSPAARKLDEALAAHVSGPNRRAMLRSAASKHGLDLATLREAELATLATALESALRIFVADPAAVRAVLAPWFAAPDATLAEPVTVDVASEQDILNVRSAVRAACHAVEGNTSYTTRLLTASSELARNIQMYAGKGRIAVTVLAAASRRGVEIVATDEGPGIENVEAVLAGRHRSKLGMGAGLRGTRALVDTFDIETGPNRGTRVRIVKWRM
jgi:serine/threonine-protein kinase RsbT